MGEQFSADYSVYYLRFLATYVYYMQLTVSDSAVRVFITFPPFTVQGGGGGVSPIITTGCLKLHQNWNPRMLVCTVLSRASAHIRASATPQF